MDTSPRPPSPLRPLDRPTLLTDLPTDVLSLILSMGGAPKWQERYLDVHIHPDRAGELFPCRAVLARYLDVHIHPDRAGELFPCRAVLAAVRPPSAVWTDLAIPERFMLEEPAPGLAEMERALQDAAPSVRRLLVQGYDGAMAANRAALVAPFLRQLVVDMDYSDPQIPNPAWAVPVLAAATRLTRLDFNYALSIEGPARLIADGRAAIILFIREQEAAHRSLPDVAFEDENSDEFAAALQLHRAQERALLRPKLLALLSGLAAAAARPGGVGPIALTSLKLPLCMSEDFAFTFGLAGVARRSLTRLAIASDQTDPAQAGQEPHSSLTALIDRLPFLRELDISRGMDGDSQGVASLVGVASPPIGLTSLSVNVRASADVAIPPSIASSLLALAVVVSFETNPPQCLRSAGPGFSRLTRLAYGTPPEVRHKSINLAPWGRPEFSIPTLAELEVCGHRFVLGGQAEDLAGWATAVASATLPQVTYVRLWAFDAVHFEEAVPGASAADVERAVTRALPAAAAAAGRRLAVHVHGIERHGDFFPAYPLGRYVVGSKIFVLKYEARPAG